jgi:hypothetical protein
MTDIQSQPQPKIRWRTGKCEQDTRPHLENAYHICHNWRAELGDGEPSPDIDKLWIRWSQFRACSLGEIRVAKDFARYVFGRSGAAQEVSPEHILRNLLAVIHRDGGHYAAKHGLEKAGEDAQALVLKERSQEASQLGTQRQCPVCDRGYTQLSTGSGHRYHLSPGRPDCNKCDCTDCESRRKEKE